MAKREHRRRITGAIRPRLLYAQRVEIADRFRAWAARSACQSQRGHKQGPPRDGEALCETL